MAGLALRAPTPEGDLSFVHGEPVRIGRLEAGRDPDGAVDVTGGAADPADDVVVVVAHSCFVAGRSARRFDASQEAGRGQGVEVVVDRLGGDGSESGADDLGYAVGVEVRSL